MLDLPEAHTISSLQISVQTVQQRLLEDPVTARGGISLIFKIKEMLSEQNVSPEYMDLATGQVMEKLLKPDNFSAIEL